MSSSSTELLYFYKDTLYVLIIYEKYTAESGESQGESCREQCIRDTRDWAFGSYANGQSAHTRMSIRATPNRPFGLYATEQNGNV